MCAPLHSSFQLTGITQDNWLLQPLAVNESYLLIASLLQLHSGVPDLPRTGLVTNLVILGTEHDDHILSELSNRIINNHNISNINQEMPEFLRQDKREKCTHCF